MADFNLPLTVGNRGTVSSRFGQYMCIISGVHFREYFFRGYIFFSKMYPRKSTPEQHWAMLKQHWTMLAGVHFGEYFFRKIYLEKSTPEPTFSMLAGSTFFGSTFFQLFSMLAGSTFFGGTFFNFFQCWPGVLFSTFFNGDYTVQTTFVKKLEVWTIRNVKKVPPRKKNICRLLS